MHELTLHRPEMTQLSWICGVKLGSKLSCVELRQRIGMVDVQRSGTKK